MKITIVDPNNQEHDLDSVILEFAHLHNMIGQRLSIIEAFLGLNQAQPVEGSAETESE